MSRLPSALVIAAFAVTLAGPARAATDSLRLDRGAARERALDRAADLGGLRDGVAAARAARAVPYPHPPAIALEIEGAGAPWSGRDYARRVRLEQELDLRGERGALRQVAAARAAALGHELAGRAEEVAAAADEAYSRHLVARRRTALLEPLRDRARGLRARAEEARRRETVTGFEARLLGAEALDLEAEWLAARREGEESEAVLRALLALPAATPLALEDDLDGPAWRCDPDTAWRIGIGERAALAAAAAAESLAAARITLESRAAGRNPTLGASLARERSTLAAPGGAAIEDEATVVGVEVRMPLPLFAANADGVAAARLERARARADRAALERGIRAELAAACAALGLAEELRRLRQAALAGAAGDLERIESAYAEGRIPLDEYLTLRERVVRQPLALLDAVLGVEEARARLARATGLDRDALARRLGAAP